MPPPRCFRLWPVFEAVLGDVTSVDTIVFFPFAHFQLLLNQLSGLFVALISVLAFAGFDLRSVNYFDEYPGKNGPRRLLL